jgi:hypothetical protein
MHYDPVDDPADVPAVQELRLTPALRAVVAWTDAEFYLGTAEGEQRWERFRAAARTAQRRYAWACALMGLVVGAGAGRVAATDAVTPREHLLSLAGAYLTVPGLAWWWGWLLRRGIAPISLRNGQRIARASYVLVGVLVLLLSPIFAEHRVGWGIVAAVLVALPWLASAYLETHRATFLPYPAEWKRFDSG